MEDLKRLAEIKKNFDDDIYSLRNDGSTVEITYKNLQEYPMTYNIETDGFSYGKGDFYVSGNVSNLNESFVELQRYYARYVWERVKEKLVNVTPNKIIFGDYVITKKRSGDLKFYAITKNESLMRLEYINLIPNALNVVIDEIKERFEITRGILKYDLNKFTELYDEKYEKMVGQEVSFIPEVNEDESRHPSNKNTRIVTQKKPNYTLYIILAILFVISAIIVSILITVVVWYFFGVLVALIMLRRRNKNIDASVFLSWYKVHKLRIGN